MLGLSAIQPISSHAARMPTRGAASHGSPTLHTREVDELQAAVGGGAAEVRDAVHHDGQHAAPCERHHQKKAQASCRPVAGQCNMSLVVLPQEVLQSTAFVDLWDRLERSFILVSATARFAAPRAMTASTSGVLDTHTCGSTP
jgi:hypothetical protein